MQAMRWGVRLLVLMVLSGGCFAQSVTQSTLPGSVLHVVLLQFKPEVTAGQINQTIEQSILQLRQIPGVIAVDAGLKLRDDRPVHIKDFQVGIMVRLSDPAALDAYAGHGLHKAFLQQHQALFSKIQVIDFSSAAPAAP